MDSTVSPRLVTSLLALLFCAVASLHAGDAKPARIVTEVVAIALVSPRAAAQGAPDLSDASVLHLAASGEGGGPPAVRDLRPIDTSTPMGVEPPRPMAIPAAPVKPPRAHAPLRVVAQAPAAARKRTAPKVRTAPVQRPSMTAQAKPAAPDVPAMFIPLRQLGLEIQTRLPPAPRAGEQASTSARPSGVAKV